MLRGYSTGVCAHRGYPGAALAADPAADRKQAFFTSASPAMPRPILATVHTAALRHNLQIARERAPDARLWAVVKANAYGHGIERCFDALRSADGFALLDLDEAQRVRALGWRGPILLLEGCFEAGEYAIAAQLGLGVMETALSKRPYLASTCFGIADIALFAYTHCAEDGGFVLETLILAKVEVTQDDDHTVRVSGIEYSLHARGEGGHPRVRTAGRTGHRGRRTASPPRRCRCWLSWRSPLACPTRLKRCFRARKSI